jgi:hypothetical protein
MINADSDILKTKFTYYQKYIGIHHPSGQPISPHRLRCSPFAVFKYSFLSRYLVAAAISTGE